MLVVGLTGGIACGKSAVSAGLRNEGVPVIDCDVIAHDAAAKGTWGYRRIVAAFGPGILTSSGDIDRPQLASIVFADAAARRRLNKATHLPISCEILRQLLVHWLLVRQLVVIDMPLLFESNAHKLVGMVVVVACSPRVQLERLMLRDGSTAANAQARIAAQMSLERKAEMADLVLSNDGSAQELQEQVSGLAAVLQRRSRSWAHKLLSPPAVALAALALAAASLRALS